MNLVQSSNHHSQSFSLKSNHTVLASFLEIEILLRENNEMKARTAVSNLYTIFTALCGLCLLYMLHTLWVNKTVLMIEHGLGKLLNATRNC